MHLMAEAIPTVIFSDQPEDLSDIKLEDTESTFFNTEKSLKKYLRSNTVSLVILHIHNKQTENAARQLSEYIRQSLADKKIAIVALTPNDYPVDELVLLDTYGIDTLIAVSDVQLPVVNARLNRLLARLKNTDDIIQQKEAQTSLLMSVHRFARHRQSIQSLITECAVALGSFCCATSSVVAFQSTVTAVQLQADKVLLDQAQIEQLKEEGLRAIIHQSFSRTTPNIDLLTNSTLTGHLNELYGQPIGSYLIFPIHAYGKTLAVIFCFIAEANMHQVSTQHLNVMRDTAEQLRLVLERRGAESRLKAQYHRLKSTLSELQTTQDQLLHAEKMASVGQMAAGIAHEINNPLASVISNFDPLSDYVVTLIKMLELHDALMVSIDKPGAEQLQKHEAHQHLSSFKEESDLDFVVDDIKAIVNDSREGLLRVRDIISDLSSFSHKQELEKKAFYLKDLFDETLRLLKTDITSDINLTQTNEIEEPILAHRGFVQQILTNLIKNAVQALVTDGSAGKEKCIQIEAYRGNQDELCISVKDNGPGISDELKKQIFSPFFTTKEIGKGTGLGLSVSYNLAKKMGGTLSLNNTANNSTTFTLTLPAEGE